jgi:hypothetical protein
MAVMILRHKILGQLRDKRDRFLSFDDDFHTETQRYSEALSRLARLSHDEVITRLAGRATPGALPTPEFDRAPDLCVNFPPRWSNHEEARRWAWEALLEHPTFAVDGSQILPSKDLSIPVAAIQVAWFANTHTRDGRYTKDIAFEILAPDELVIDYQGERQVSEQAVNLRRFRMEVETLCRLMKQLEAGRQTGAPLAVAFFDSSLVISFADRLQAEQRAEYIRIVLELLRCSEHTGVPVVGFVDTSYARDLTNMLAHCFGLREAEKLHDAQLVDQRLDWGARTPLFICARPSADRKREGVLESFAEYRRRVGFVYLKTNRAAPPARLDIPLWVYERGLLDEVIDLVRAEVIVGNGYPYVIETADAAAVINTRDREAFYAIFQRFVTDQGVALRRSQKTASKARRR